MEFKKLLTNLENKHNIDLLDISPFFIEGELWLEQQLIQKHKDNYDNNYRLVCYFSKDQYEYSDYPGSLCFSFCKLISKIDISEYFVILVSNDKNTNNNIQKSKELLRADKHTVYNVDEISMSYYYVTDINAKVQPPILKKKNYTCSKLWNHLHININGDVLPCCTSNKNISFGNVLQDNISNIHNSDIANNMRSDMLKNKKVYACKFCYDREDRGIQSFRKPFEIEPKHKITNMDIRLSNICNLKCRMCTGAYSSRIAKEEMQNYDVQYEIIENIDYKTEKNILNLLPNLESIYFAGGEPLLMDIHYKILKELIRLDHTSIKIKYNTNFTKLTYKNINVIDLWKYFPNIEIGASLDAIGNHIEHLRNGTKWQDIVDNFNKLKASNVDAKFKITANINIYNAFNLIKAQQFWIENDVTTHQITILSNPTELSIQVLPSAFKKNLKNEIKKHISYLQDKKVTNLIDDWNKVLIHLNDKDLSFLLKDFFNKNDLLDRLRNEVFEDVYSEYKDLRSYV